MKATVSQLRRLLFDNSNLYAVIGEHEYTNSEARKALYDMPNQDTEYNHMVQGDCLHVWAVKA